jgi:AAA domain
LFSNETLWQSGVPERAILSDLRLDPPHYIEGLKKLLSHFRTKYDYIIIDTRGGYDFTSAVPALLSDTYIIVLEPDRVSLEQIQGFDKATKEFADTYKLRIPLRGFVVNKAAFDPTESRFVEELTRTYGIKTYGVVPADLSCIRAYEKTESPILRFPYSDFAFWSMRAIEGFIAPELNWTNQEDVERFTELRKSIGKEWAGRKRTDKIISWLPFLQLIPIVFAALLYLIYRRWPSDITLFSMYTLVVVFITWSMIGSTLSGLEWLRWRNVSAQVRKPVLGAAGVVIASLMLLMSFDIPQRIFLISLPPQAVAVGQGASKGTSELQKQALQISEAWKQLAFDAINRSEDKISTQVEAFLRKSLNIAALEPIPDNTKGLVSVLTKQIIEETRSRVQTAATAVAAAIDAEAGQTRSAIDAIVWILQHPRATIDARVEKLERAAPAVLEFPPVFDILDAATHSILNPGQLPHAPGRTDAPPSSPR